MMYNKDGGTVVPVMAMLANDGGAGVNVDIVRGHFGMVVVVSACIFASGSRFTLGMVASAEVRVGVFEKMRMGGHQ